MATPAEVCDHRECPAKAHIVFVLDDSELVFCSHHSEQLKNDLELAGWEYIPAPKMAMRVYEGGR